MLDRSGFAIVEGGICTTLRDLARFGLMCLEDGRALGHEVVPPTGSHACACATTISSPPSAPRPTPIPPPDAFYHDKWWVDDGPRGVYRAWA